MSTDDAALRKELDRVLALLRAQSLKGTVVCFSCWREWRAVMSINQVDALPHRRIMCPHCKEHRGLFVEDPWDNLEKLKKE